MTAIEVQEKQSKKGKRLECALMNEKKAKVDEEMPQQTRTI